MKKNQYIAPSVEIHTLEAENMMVLSATRNPADKDNEVLTNERDDEYSDIWELFKD